MPVRAYLIADPNGPRRNAMMARHLAFHDVSVFGTATISDACRLVKLRVPVRVFVAIDFSSLNEFGILARAIEKAGAELCVYSTLSDIAAIPAANFGAAAYGVAARFPNRSGRKEYQLETPEPPQRTPFGTSLSQHSHPAPASFPQRPEAVICLGASTGGVSALETVLGAFPADCPPTLVVQHMRPGFTEGLIRRLDGVLAPHVTVATESQPLVRGTVYLAASDEYHLGILPGHTPRLRLMPGEPVAGHRPSIDVLFSQAAALAARMSVRAALLTGMGADGADGMCALRRAGALTIAQDQHSSVVWGMPRVAIERGGAAEILPLARIGDALIHAVPIHKRFSS